MWFGKTSRDINIVGTPEISTVYAAEIVPIVFLGKAQMSGWSVIT
jgi:hypothetical protein